MGGWISGSEVMRLTLDSLRRRLAHTLERRLLPLSHRGGPALLPHDVYIRTKNILAAMHVGGKDIEVSAKGLRIAQGRGCIRVHVQQA